MTLHGERRRVLVRHLCSRLGPGWFRGPAGGSGQILVLLALLLGASPSAAEIYSRHTGVATRVWADQGPGHQIWDYEFYELLKKNLYQGDAAIYQDLQLVFDICYGGGVIDWITAHGGLKGTWSAASGANGREIQVKSWTDWDGATALGGGGGRKDVWKHPGLKVSQYKIDGDPTSGKRDQYVNSYTAQYLKAIEDNAQQNVKQLHDTALKKYLENANAVAQGKYASSGAAADAFTIKGNDETKSRHGIAYQGGSYNTSDQHVYERLLQILGDAGYKGDTGSIQKLFHRGDPPLEKPTASGVSTADWKPATYAELDKALQQLRTELLKNPGKEKALVYVTGHGTSFRETRAQKLKDGDPPLPGEGFVFEADANTMRIALDGIDQLLMQEEINDGSGRFLRDDPALQRLGPPVLNFTTYAQSISGPVRVFLDDYFAGSVVLSGARGDYTLALRDDLVSSIGWTNADDILLDVRFEFASAADWFQLSTEYDYFQDPAFSAEFGHFGLGLSNVMYQGFPIPEPGLAFLAPLAMVWLLWPRRTFGSAPGAP